MGFIIYIGSLYPPVVIVCGADWVQGGQMWAPESLGKKNKNFFYLFLKHCYECEHVYYDVTWVLSENKLLRYILYQKP